MIGSTIYSERFITFSSHAADAMKAALEIDNDWDTCSCITTHEDTIVVDFRVSKTKDLKKAMEITEKILKKYNIPYRKRTF